MVLGKNDARYSIPTEQIEPFRCPILGWMMQVLGWCLIVIAVASVIGICLVPVIGVLILVGGKLRAETAETILSRDTRRPVLYLRSFNDEVDESTFALPQGQISDWYFGWHPFVRIWLEAT